MKSGISLLCLATMFASCAAMADVNSFTAGRAAVYIQDGASSVSLESTAPFKAEVSVDESDSTLFSAGVLSLPDGLSTQDLTYDANDGWMLEGEFDTIGELNTAVPAGNYTLNMTKTAGGTTPVSFVISSLDMPEAPVITNYEDLQSFDSTQALTITWNAWSGGSDNDYIIVEIEKDNQQGGSETMFSIYPEDDNPLLGTATSVTVPAGTMTEGETYNLSVSFTKIFAVSWSGSVTDFPDAMVASYAQTETNLTIESYDPNPNLFETLSHTGDWVIPSSTDDKACFGWVYDLYYPWVYSASLDIVKNGSYTGGIDGWIYILPDGSLNGFYFYRCDKANWAWGSYYGEGWIYDYETSSWEDITP